jgi:signal transduction protein with GAF and PtsI domain
MSGQRIFDDRDQETMRLRQRIEALEARMEALLDNQKKLVEHNSQRVLEIYDAIIEVRGQIKLIIAVETKTADGHARCIMDMASDAIDLTNRVSNLEHVIFPNLASDMAEIEKIIPSTEECPPRHLDHRDNDDRKND